MSTYLTQTKFPYRGTCRSDPTNMLTTCQVSLVLAHLLTAKMIWKLVYESALSQPRFTIRVT